MLQGFEAGRVSAARLLSSKVRNLTIVVESLAGFAFEPGADVAIRLPRGAGGADERHYSVWKSTREGKFDLCVVLHGLGPGSRWAARCSVGDPVEISRSPALPIALDRSVETHLLFGDETSIASAEALIRALPAEAAVLACFEVPSTDHRWPELEVARPEDIHWVDRAGRPGSALVSWLARQSLPFVNSSTAYVTGEAWLCAIVHAHLVRDRGFPRGRGTRYAVLEDQVQCRYTRLSASALAVSSAQGRRVTHWARCKGRIVLHLEHPKDRFLQNLTKP